MSIWGDGEKPARAKAYADAMATVARANPNDDEAQVFYALALLATMPRGDASLPIREQAGAIVDAVFARNPKHPGAAHLILHAYDHGRLAARGLAAARAYAKIAPAASHALHMPAHFFVQLGYWADAAASDRASWAASVAWASRGRRSVVQRDFHSLAWLQYELTQLGRFTEDGSRRVLRITEVLGLDANQQYQTRDLFVRQMRGRNDQGQLEGGLEPTGEQPTFAADPLEQGILDRVVHSRPLWRLTPL